MKGDGQLYHQDAAQYSVTFLIALELLGQDSVGCTMGYSALVVGAHVWAGDGRDGAADGIVAGCVVGVALVHADE